MSSREFLSILLLSISFVSQSQRAYHDFDQENIENILYEDFESLIGWDQESIQFKLKSIRGGVKHISIGGPNTNRISFYNEPIDLPPKYQIEFVVKHLSGLTGFKKEGKDVYDFGGPSLYWNISKKYQISKTMMRHSDKYIGYNRITLLDNGTIMIGADNIIYPQGKDDMNAFKPDDFNKITLRKYSNRFYLFLNEVFLTSLDADIDSEIGRYLGIGSGCAMRKNGSAEYKYIKVSKLDFISARPR